MNAVESSSPSSTQLSAVDSCATSSISISISTQESAPLTDSKATPPANKKPRSPQAARPKIEFLDGLRGLAAIFVVLHHAHILEAGVNIGGSAVDIFFVLSSFLLTMIFEAKTRQLLARQANLRAWAFTLLDYASKRFLRVYPLFAAVAVMLWCLPNESRSRYYTIGSPEEYDLLKVLTFEEHSRYFVMWTLPLEITYYFFIPVLVVGICLLGRAWWLAVASLYMWVIEEGLRVDRRPFQPLRPHLSTFVAGSLAAIVYAQLNRVVKERGIEFSGWKFVTLVRCAQLAALALTMSLSFHGLFFNWIAPNPFMQHEGASPFLSLPISLVIVLEILFPSLLSQLLDWKLLSYAGKISFSMYMLHPFVIKNAWIEGGQKTWHDQFFAWFVLVFLLSTASYWAIEYPSQLLAQRVSARLNAWERQHGSSSSHPPTPANLERAAYHLGLQRSERKPVEKFV